MYRCGKQKKRCLTIKTAETLVPVHTQCFLKNISKSKDAFSLAELLITIGIIGVVATMVIPAMIQKSQDAEFKTAKDKVRMSIGEAGRILSVTDEISSASSAEDFVKNYLSKQLKISKYCDPSANTANMEQCGMPSGNPTKFKKEDGTVLTSMPKTWSGITYPYGVTVPAVEGYGTYSTSNPTTSGAFNNSYAFLSADGIAVNLFYNPYCVYTKSEKPYYNAAAEAYTTEKRQFSLDTACMAGVYDMNGLKKPNQVGRDIGFFGVFYNGIQATAVATLPYKEGYTSGYNWSQSDTYCRGIKGYKLPTVDELSALYLGSRITTIPNNVRLWSASSLPGSSYARGVDFDGGDRYWIARSSSGAGMCVRD